MAIGTVAHGKALGRVGVHVDLIRVPSAVRAGCRDVFRIGDHSVISVCFGKDME